MLRALSGPLAGATFEVGPRVLIGRMAACDVQIVDVEVSREHAMIVTHDRQPTLVDLDSRNGTYIDGERVQRVPLQAGDKFSIAGSEFIYDRAAPISTTPVLSTQFGVDPSAPRSRSGQGEAHPTRETASAKPTRSEVGAVDERDTQRAMAAAKDAPPVPAPVADPATPSKPPAVSRPTVRLEAATAPAAPTEAEDKATVQIRAAKGPTAPQAEHAARATASLAALAATPKAPEPPPSFTPPPVPTERVATARAPGPSKTSLGAYNGDLFKDITAYRSFRLQLQRGEMPSGEEVSAMIDLEAELREPVETDPRRDVVTKRFFRRFPFATSLQARFSTSGRMVTAEGTTTNLSADGLQCSLELGKFSPKPEQLAMLVIEHERDGVEVRYSVTARVVWSRNRVAGFVFAGVPSWSERGDFDDVDTAVRTHPMA
ncbi:MAG: FHA domain-containing protein [Nannocystales bacterium]